ncbi:MAG TPA: hypothetical protein VNE40_03470 [Candidatus Dormibacteraeota bacterium]|nr:hypothetical protein [Candidatus Dormibacteraeota bacterium]
MYSFLVLGLVPGTNLQITFKIWIDLIGLMADGIALVWLYQKHRPAVLPQVNDNLESSSNIDLSQALSQS